MREPVVALHAAVLRGHRHGRNRAVAGAVRSQESARIGEHAAARRSNRTKPPSELVMRGSTASAAASARFAISMRSSVGSSAVSSEKSCRSPVSEPSSPASGKPACGSSVVSAARSIAERTICRMPSGVRSDVYDAPMRLPISTRNPGAARAGFFQRFQFAHAHVGGKFVAFRRWCTRRRWPRRRAPA